MVNLIKSSHELILSIFNRISGIKVLILDNETMQMISLVFTQTELLEKEVFLSELIHVNKKEKFPYFSGIYFIRPNRDNISMLCNELKDPLFKEYYVYFTNNISPEVLQKMAISDTRDVIKRVQEVRFDINIINSDLFSLNLSYFASMYNLPSKWTTYEESLFKRIIDGIYSACIFLGETPIIRYLSNSPLCRNVAFAIERRLMDRHPVDLLMNDNTLSEEYNEDKRNENYVLLILDRREDPVTPLLTQWTYQAMIHELLNIKQNKTVVDDTEIVISEQFDDFFKINMYENFGDIGFSIRNLVNEHQEATKKNYRIETIEDISRFVQIYPEFKKESSNIYKHVNILHELSKIVQNRDLMRISALEQDIFINDNILEHSKEVGKLLSDSEIDSFDKLRVALIYSLKYQQQEIEINNFKYILGNDSKYIDKLIEIAGNDFRSGDLFQNKSLLSIAKNTIKRNNNTNIYIQHKSVLYNILENLVRGKLKYNKFPSTDDSIVNKKPHKIMVFILGGATFEEARDINTIKNLYDLEIILGGTSIHNSKSFISDIELMINS